MGTIVDTHKNNLYLDFFLPDYNIAIECHGEQHFKPINFFGGYESFLKYQKRDIIKYELCKEHGIKILYFSDDEYEYFDKIYNDENKLIKYIIN